MLQNAAFAVVLQDDQNSFRPTISPTTPPVRREPCFSEIAVFGAHSAKSFAPSAVPNNSLGVYSLFSLRPNSLALCHLACEQEKG